MSSAREKNQAILETIRGADESAEEERKMMAWRKIFGVYIATACLAERMGLRPWHYTVMDKRVQDVLGYSPEYIDSQTTDTGENRFEKFGAWIRQRGKTLGFFLQADDDRSGQWLLTAAGSELGGNILNRLITTAASMGEPAVRRYDELYQRRKTLLDLLGDVGLSEAEAIEALQFHSRGDDGEE